MLAATHPVPAVKTTIWAGRIISTLAMLFLAFDCIIKVLNLPPAVEATTQLGYPASLVIGIGMLQLACLAFYTIPRTSILGAILLTGYLGGAIATQVRAVSPLFSVVFPIIIGRGRDTDTCLNDPYVSRAHCRIELRGTDLTLVALTKNSGTFVNEGQISEHVGRKV